MEALVRWEIETTCNDVTRGSTMVFYFIAQTTARLLLTVKSVWQRRFHSSALIGGRGVRIHTSHVSKWKSNRREIRRHFSVPTPALMAVEDFLSA